jgi:predicted nucleic acid-binding protein
MGFRVVLDACVLYPASVRDALLRLAEIELYDILWSERILDEVERNLIEHGRATLDQASRLRAAMEGAFEGAAAPEEAIARLEPAMENDPKDRHVLAAAVASDADAIVTDNLKDFPEEACAAHGVEVISADEFLCQLFDLDPEEVVAAIARQAAALKNPPMGVEELVDILRAAGCVVFSERLRKLQQGIG